MISTDEWISEATSTLAPLANVKEVAAVLRTTPRNVKTMLSRGRLTAIRPTESGSSRLLIPRKSVEAYLHGLASPEAPTTRTKSAKPARKGRAA